MNQKQREQLQNDLPDGLAQPARRALAAAGIGGLRQLTRFSEAEVKQMHGIGPNALQLLRRALGAKGFSFRSGGTGKGGRA